MFLLTIAVLVATGETPSPSHAASATIESSAGPAQPVVPEEPISVAVLDLKAVPGTEGAARALTTLVTNEIGSRKGFKAVSRSEVKSLLVHQADQRLVGCQEAQCLADIGKLLHAQRVVAGAVERVAEDTVVFSLTMVDPEGPTVLERVAYTWRSNVDEMVDLARPAVDRLLLGKEAEALVGAIEILSNEKGASVVVDDKEIGTTPLPSPVRDLTIGVHRVELRKPGFVPWGKSVAVTHGETQIVQADLVDEASLQPWYGRWYVWGSALAGVVIIGGTAAAIGTYSYLSTPTKLVVGGPQ